MPMSRSTSPDTSGVASAPAGMVSGSGGMSRRDLSLTTSGKMDLPFLPDRIQEVGES